MVKDSAQTHPGGCPHTTNQPELFTIVVTRRQDTMEVEMQNTIHYPMRALEWKTELIIAFMRKAPLAMRAFRDEAA